MIESLTQNEIVVQQHSLIDTIELSLGQREKENIIISEVTLGKDSQVVSRYKDSRWDFWPYAKTKNYAKNVYSLNWDRIPSSYIDPLKSILYRYWKTGVVGTPVTIRTVRGTYDVICNFIEWLCQHSVHHLSDIKPLHVSSYIQHCKSIKKKNGTTLSSGNLMNQFRAVEILYHFRNEHKDQLSFHRWPESSAKNLANHLDYHRKSRTNLIPDEVAQTLFKFSEEIVNDAGRWLDARGKSECIIPLFKRLPTLISMTFLGLGNLINTLQLLGLPAICCWALYLVVETMSYVN
jgi:hypothetical protein